MCSQGRLEGPEEGEELWRPEVDHARLARITPTSPLVRSCAWLRAPPEMIESCALAQPSWRSYLRGDFTLLVSASSPLLHKTKEGFFFLETLSEKKRCDPVSLLHRLHPRQANNSQDDCCVRWNVPAAVGVSARLALLGTFTKTEAGLQKFPCAWGLFEALTKHVGSSSTLPEKA